MRIATKAFHAGAAHTLSMTHCSELLSTEWKACNGFAITVTAKLKERADTAAEVQKAAATSVELHRIILHLPTLRTEVMGL